MISTILVPIVPPALDHERVSTVAIPVARALATRNHARVVLLSVVDIGTGTKSALAARRELERLATEFGDGPVELAINEGEPPEEIVAAARSSDALIVMGSHARAGLRRMIVGSVAFRVVHDADNPVVIVPVHAATVEPWTLGRVVVPVGGRPEAEHILDTALDVLGPELDLHLVEVIEPLVRRSGATVRQYYAIGRDLATQHLTDVAARLAERGCHVTWEICVGAPEVEIARVARRQQASLIALTTHGRLGFGRFIMGSTAEYLAHAGGIPLLLSRPRRVTPITVEGGLDATAARLLTDEPPHDDDRHT